MKKINSAIIAITASLSTANFAHAVDIIEYDSSKHKLSTIINNIIGWALGFAGALAVLFIIYGGFLYVTSGGSKDRVEQGKKTLTYAIIGLVIVVLSYMIVTVVEKTAGVIV